MKFINVSYMHTNSLSILDVSLLFYFMCYVFICTCVWEGNFFIYRDIYMKYIYIYILYIDGRDLNSNPYAQAVIVFIYWAVSPIHLDIILLNVFNLFIFNYNSLHDVTYRALHYGYRFGIRKFYIWEHLRFQILAYGCSFKV